ncbi:hypothetical protein BDB01DRAFT_782262 [Pilobolus umbonatus]|nr:hypothetical protein BDB01DRAFT_782262 [Pilobolus umbonatus]
MLTAPYIHFNQQEHQFDSNKLVTMVDYTNLYIKNLDPDVTSYDLFRKFKSFGKIVSARVMKDPSTGLSKGYGFVSFNQLDEAEAALHKMNGALINTKHIIISFHEHKKYLSPPPPPPPQSISRKSQNYPVQNYNPYHINHSMNNNVLPNSCLYSYSTPYSPCTLVNNNNNTNSNNTMNRLDHSVKTSTINPWNPTGIWINKPTSPEVPHYAYTQSMHASKVLSNAPSSTLVSPSVIHDTNYLHHYPPNEPSKGNHIQQQKIRDAVYQQLAEYQNRDLDDLVDMIQSLKKRELSLCLFNPTFLKQKIDEAYEALSLFKNDHNMNQMELLQKQSVSMTASTTTIATTPSLIHRHLDDEILEEKAVSSDHHVSAAGILSSLEGMSTNKKKRILGDILFPYVKSTGIKRSPYVTIHLLDHIPLEELVASIYDINDLKKKAHTAYLQLYSKE